MLTRFLQEPGMSLKEIEQAVLQLPSEELAAFAEWFETYLADAWDRRIETDIAAGKLDQAAREADKDFESECCAPL
jgi:hypothetical protein